MNGTAVNWDWAIAFDAMIREQSEVDASARNSHAVRVGLKDQESRRMSKREDPSPEGAETAWNS